MIKDYAQQPAAEKKPKRKRGLPAVIITLAIAVPALMYIVKYHKTAQHKKQLPAPQATSTKKPSAPTQEFDFYTLLPKS